MGVWVLSEGQFWSSCQLGGQFFFLCLILVYAIDVRF
jgi:hypothetical protein